MSDPYPLYPKQREAILKLRGRKRFALFAKMQTGKTAVILKHLTYLRAQSGVKKILVLAPPSAIPAWVKNISEWAPWFLMHTYVGNRAAFDEWNSVPEGLMVLSYQVTGSCDRAEREASKVYADCVKKVDCIICDESHRIKNYTAQRTRFALSLSRKADYRYLMTGTPMGGSEEDFFYQMKFLDRDFWGWRSKRHFLSEWFHPVDRGQRTEWHFKEDRRAEFDAHLATKSMSVRMKDVRGSETELDEETVLLEPTAEQETLLARLRNEYIVEMERGEVRAVTAAAMLQKANQIENGHVLDSDGVAHDLAESPKTEWFERNAADIAADGKAILWVIYKRDRTLVKRSLDRLGIGYVDFKSGLSPKKRGELIDVFHNSERKRFFIAHPGSAGEGVNLHVAPTSIVYSRNHDWLAFAQASARNRGVQTDRVRIISPMIKGGVDEHIHKRLESKGARAEESMARGVMNSWASS